MLEHRELETTLSTHEIISQLDDLKAEAVKHRNRLIPPLEDFDYEVERQKIRDWKEPANRALKDYPHLFSRIRTLNLYDAIFHRVEGKSQGQEQLESIWTEILDRLENIIQRLGESET